MPFLFNYFLSKNERSWCSVLNWLIFPYFQLYLFLCSYFLSAFNLLIPHIMTLVFCIDQFILLFNAFLKTLLFFLSFFQGLGASLSGSDCSYMVVFQYGSIVLFNVREHEVDKYLKIVEKHASGLLPEMRKDGKILYFHISIFLFYICNVLKDVRCIWGVLPNWGEYTSRRTCLNFSK